MYSYNIMISKINSLIKKYSFLSLNYIGNSVLGKPIPCVRIGTGNKEIFYSAAYHANEWITSLILLKFIEDFCLAYSNSSTIFGYDSKTLFENCSVYIVPMVNPDGVDLVLGMYSLNSTHYLHSKFIANSYPDIPFPNGWKANMTGVDLNLQFPAGWEKAKEIKYSKGFSSPAPRDFVGYSPLTEPEALAIHNFTLSHNFNLVIAYHNQGKEIYLNYLDFAPNNAKHIANQFSKASGYKVATVPYASSFAGYKDWFLQTYSKPAYTIEAGLGENPLPISDFDKIYSDNLGILVLGMIF